jgi:copper chaperone NosL
MAASVERAATSVAGRASLATERWAAGASAQRRMMSGRARLLTMLGSLLLLGMFLVPLWSITLHAPQYPEGLGLRIRLTTVTGERPNDLATINGLNHYIGMRPINPDAIPELRYFPFVVGALVALGLGAAVFARRKLLVGWLAGLVVFGIVGLVDFWRWAYDYGHNLDAEHAIIKVPGMSYQPPLIGSKQLLNFTADSWPALGTWLALAAFALGIAALVVDRRRAAPTPSAVRVDTRS